MDRQFLEVLFLLAFQVVLQVQANQDFLCLPCCQRVQEFLSYQVDQQDLEVLCVLVHLWDLVIPMNNFE